ncbi:MAG: hypothetical protein C7B45_12950 [Sulfobacillus acidophilus]|uniref:histidine kinase n=1 Tax=Sulfobacillus acidophilus TaxID=53633 RepID=A0A2T2WF47_9FIRM|nr:MAG: hypothetical protein C7B45_12950 [Sulfobacillus acidophilus]
MIVAGLRRYRRQWLMTAILVFIGVIAPRFVHDGTWLLIGYLAVYAAWVWVPEPYRTLRNTLILTALSVVGLIWACAYPGLRTLAAALILPYAAILGGRASKSNWMLGAVVLLVLIRIAMLPINVNNIISAVVGVLGIYWGVYGIRVRREAQALDRERMNELQSAYHQLQEAHQRLVETTQEVAESRAREARLETLADIHDGVGHRLTSLIIGLESLDMMLPDDPKTAAVRVPDLVKTAREALQDVRQAVQARSQDVQEFDRGALEVMIQRVNQYGQTHVEVDVPRGFNHWPAVIRMALYHVVQESLTNVLRHAQADYVTVRVTATPSMVTVNVRDNGSLASPPSLGFGLNRLRRRCEALGGDLTLSVAVPHGLDLQATLPFPQGVHRYVTDPDLLSG